MSAKNILFYILAVIELFRQRRWGFSVNACAIFSGDLTVTKKYPERYWKKGLRLPSSLWDHAGFWVNFWTCSIRIHFEESLDSLCFVTHRDCVCVKMVEICKEFSSWSDAFIASFKTLLRVEPDAIKAVANEKKTICSGFYSHVPLFIFWFKIQSLKMASLQIKVTSQAAVREREKKGNLNFKSRFPSLIPRMSRALMSLLDEISGHKTELPTSNPTALPPGATYSSLF